MLDELLIIGKIKDGDIKAFEATFRTFYTPLYLYSLSITGNKASAEDIVQELFYVLWKERKELAILYSLKSYLYKAVKNRSLNYLEKQKTHRDHEGNIAACYTGSAEMSPQAQLEYKEFDTLITKFLMKLPERRQRIFKWHRFENKKYTEIADKLAVSVKTVEAEMSKALKLLRKEIEHYTKNYDIGK